MTTPSSALRVAYLGPAGTFTEQALLTQPDLAAAERVLLPSFPDVFYAATHAQVDLAFAAIENSIEGSVNVTIDTLAFEADLLIQREVVIPIVMNLLVQPGTALSDVKTVLSFPHAVAQCRGWLREHLPEVGIQAANSTADAVRTLAESAERTTAAVGTSLAADIYGLAVLEDDIEDHPENQTRFVLVAPGGIPAPTGHDKTSIVIFQRRDRPGSLLGILQEFAARSINLTKLESRPTKRALGDYCFLIDLEGHVADEVVADCLRNLRAKQADVKFLGSYPAAGERADDVRQEASELWDSAGAWLDELRDQVGSSPVD
ncbi:MAG: prephenate dehydratase [Acidimicrobiia bacterium]|nr:prephenate dehydratase [Acidimicrobiia bacterium]